MLFIGSILIAVAATILYHLAQKGTPGSANPLLALAVAYAVALAICLAGLLAAPPEEGFAAALRGLNWASLALGLAIFGIEIGFLLAYRAGWEVSLAALLVNAAATALLIPLGALLFAERLSLSQVIGVVVCLAGLVLLNRR